MIEWKGSKMVENVMKPNKLTANPTYSKSDRTSHQAFYIIYTPVTVPTGIGTNSIAPEFFSIPEASTGTTVAS
jgi:hypothetical protein